MQNAMEDGRGWVTESAQLINAAAHMEKVYRVGMQIETTLHHIRHSENMQLFERFEVEM